MHSSPPVAILRAPATNSDGAGIPLQQLDISSTKSKLAKGDGWIRVDWGGTGSFWAGRGAGRSRMGEGGAGSQ